MSDERMWGNGPNQPAPQPTGWQSPQQPTQFQRPPSFQQPPASQPQPGPQPPPPFQQQAPAPAKSRKSGGRGIASLVAVAVLAAGVGGGTAVLASHYLDDSPTPAVEQPAAGSDDTGAAQPGGAVIQTDPNAPNWTAVADVAAKSVVAIQMASDSGAGQGSGVVIDKAGNIVTNNHVVNGATQILVTLGSTTYPAELVGVDPSTDLAVIRLVDPPSDLQPLPWGDSNAVKVGDPTMAIGNPLGLSNTITTGIVSALDRPVTTKAVGGESKQPGSDAVVTAAIQTNAAINPGNSGGALVNGAGELIGITSSIASMSDGSGQQSGNIGIGFAIPASQAKHVAQQLIDNGEAVYPQIGITASDPRRVGPMGAEVATVVDGSPAAKAGIRPGDVITKVADRRVSSTAQLVGLVRGQQVGKTVKVTFVRDGKEQTVDVPLAAAQR